MTQIEMEARFAKIESEYLSKKVVYEKTIKLVKMQMENVRKEYEGKIGELKNKILDAEGCLCDLKADWARKKTRAYQDFVKEEE